MQTAVISCEFLHFSKLEFYFSIKGSNPAKVNRPLETQQLKQFSQESQENVRVVCSFLHRETRKSRKDNCVHEFQDWPKCAYNAQVRLRGKPQAKRHSGSRACYLCHHAVCTCVLLILEDDVGVVVGGQVLEALGVPGNFPFVPPAGPQSLLGHVGAELFIGDRNQLPRRTPLSVASTRSATLAHRREEKGAPEEVRHQR